MSIKFNKVQLVLLEATVVVVVVGFVVFVVVNVVVVALFLITLLSSINVNLRLLQATDVFLW